MSPKPYPRLDSPVLTTIAFAIGTLWANWIWADWFTQAKDMEIVLLAMVSLVGYPLTLAIAAGIPMYVMLRLKDHFWVCAAFALGVLGVGMAVYGIPSLWSLGLCAVITVAMGLTSFRTARDESDLEDL